MSNVEGMYPIYFIKMTERSENILGDSIFEILRFCGSLFEFEKFHIRYQQIPNPETRNLKPEHLIGPKACNMYLCY